MRDSTMESPEDNDDGGTKTREREREGGGRGEEEEEDIEEDSEENAKDNIYEKSDVNTVTNGNIYDTDKASGINVNELKIGADFNDRKIHINENETEIETNEKGGKETEKTETNIDEIEVWNAETYKIAEDEELKNTRAKEEEKEERREEQEEGIDEEEAGEGGESSYPEEETAGHDEGGDPLKVDRGGEEGSAGLEWAGAGYGDVSDFPAASDDRQTICGTKEPHVPCHAAFHHTTAPPPPHCTAADTTQDATRTASVKKGTTGGHGSATLGRRSRRSNLAPPTDPREARSHTEPPPERPPPDLLQVSWEWDTRKPTRTATMRRRPSCKVSSRRRVRPRLSIRKVAPRLYTTSPRRIASGGDDDTWSECDEGYDEDRIVATPPQAPPHLATPDILRAGPCTDLTVPLYASPGPHPPEVTRRNARNLVANAGRAMKQRWRNSDIVLPSLLTGSWTNLKAEHSDKKKKRTLLDKARAIPLRIRKLSNRIMKVVRAGGDGDGCEKENDIIYLDLRRQVHDRVQRRRSERRRSVPALGLRHQNSVSPRNTLSATTGLTWRQRYLTVMKGDGGGTAEPPTIQVSEADVEPNTPATGTPGDDGDWCSVLTIPSPSPHTSQLGLDLAPNTMLWRLWGRLRHATPHPLSHASSRSSMSGGSEDGHSPSHSSDYEDQEDAERSGSASLVGRMRGLRRDMQKKISRLKSPRGSTSSSPVGGPADKSALTPPAQSSAVSFDSLATSGPQSKVYQMTFASPAAPTTAGSNRSSLSGEEAEPYTGPFIGRARALVDCQPSPYDRDALKFKKGDIIDIIDKKPTGLWKGCVDGRVGHFKFILVEVEVERPARRQRHSRGTTPRRGRAKTLEELLTRLNLGHLIQVFVLNGYEDLEQFRDVEKADLDCLGITDPETCAKLLTAVALLLDADSEPETDLPEIETTEVALRRDDHGRDSGCYTDHRSAHSTVMDENNLDTRQSTPSTDTSSGYHSRGAYNIPLGDPTLTSRDDTHSSALDSPPSESTTSGATGSQPSTQSEPHSYRAHLATVLPASPRTKVRHGHQEEQKQKPDSQVDFEAKYNSARNVFEKEIVRREVPYTVRSPKRSGGTSQSSNSDSDEGSAVAPEEPSA